MKSQNVINTAFTGLLLLSVVLRFLMMLACM